MLGAFVSPDRDIWSIKYIGNRVKAIKHRCKSNGIPFDLTSKFVKDMLDTQEWKCYYTGVGFVNDPDDRYNWSIDRRDPSRGYVTDNVAACCNIVNTMKGKRTEEVFVREMQEISRINNRILGIKSDPSPPDVWYAVVSPYQEWIRRGRKIGWVR